MKAIFTTIVLATICLGFGACETELPPASEVGDRFERGIVGQGTLTQPDKSEDPLIKENTRVGY